MQVPRHTVKTRMKCRTMRHFTRVCNVCYDKTIFRDKTIVTLEAPWNAKRAYQYQNENGYLYMLTRSRRKCMKLDTSILNLDGVCSLTGLHSKMKIKVLIRLCRCLDRSAQLWSHTTNRCLGTTCITIMLFTVLEQEHERKNVNMFSLLYINNRDSNEHFRRTEYI